MAEPFATLEDGKGNVTPLTEEQFNDILQNGMDPPAGFNLPPGVPPNPVRIFFVPTIAFTHIFVPPIPIRRPLTPTTLTITRAGKTFQGIIVGRLT